MTLTSPDNQPEPGPCANCGEPLRGRYCHACGQPTVVDRFTAPVLARQVLSYLTDLERGFVYTVLSIFRSPGRVVLDYWRGKTVPYYAPFRYFFITTAVLLLTNFWLGIDDVLQQALQPADLEDRMGAGSVAAADQQFDKWIQLLVVAQVPINSLSSFLLFRKHGRTYGEHLILSAFVMGNLAIVSIVAQLLVLVSSGLVLPYLVLSFVLGVAFYAFAFRTVFEENTATVIAKATLQAIVGVAAYGGLVAAASAIALALNT